MHPLLITWSPNMMTDIGKHNFDAWLNLGMPNLMFHQNQKIHRLLTRLAFLNLVHPFQPFIIGQKLAPKLAEKFNINFVMFGEHDAEFGMKMEKNNPKMDKEFLHQQKTIKIFYFWSVSDLMKKYKLISMILILIYQFKAQDLTNQKLNFIFLVIIKNGIFMIIIIM